MVTMMVSRKGSIKANTTTVVSREPEDREGSSDQKAQTSQVQFKNGEVKSKGEAVPLLGMFGNWVRRRGGRGTSTQTDDLLLRAGCKKDRKHHQ